MWANHGEAGDFYAEIHAAKEKAAGIAHRPQDNLCETYPPLTVRERQKDIRELSAFAKRTINACTEASINSYDSNEAIYTSIRKGSAGFIKILGGDTLAFPHNR